MYVCMGWMDEWMDGCTYLGIPLPSHFHTHSPSHVAAKVGSLQCIQILQAYGADFGAKSMHGATPMHEAAANGNPGLSVSLFIASS